MADKYVDIHGHKVRYDDDSETAKNAIRHLTKSLDSSEAKVFFDEAKRNLHEHTAHFEVRNHEMNRDDNLTLVHEGDGGYHLRKRKHHLL